MEQSFSEKNVPQIPDLAAGCESASRSEPVAESNDAAKLPPLEQETVHECSNASTILRVYRQGSAVTRFELGAHYAGKELVTYLYEEPIPAQIARMLGAMCDGDSSIALGSILQFLSASLSKLPSGLWKIRSCFSPAHELLAIPRVFPILPSFSEACSPSQLFSGIKTYEHRSDRCSIAMAARCDNSIGLVSLLISVAEDCKDDSELYAFEIRTPCTLETTMDEVAMWQECRWLSLVEMVKSSGISTLLRTLREAHMDTLEVDPQERRRLYVEQKLAAWELSEELASGTCSETNDVWVTTQIGIRHALVVIRHDDAERNPPRWVRFEVGHSSSPFSSVERSLLESLGPNLTSSDPSVRELAYSYLDYAPRFLGIRRNEKCQLEASCPAALSLAALKMSVRRHSPALRVLLGPEVESELVALENVSVERPPVPEGYGYLYALRGIDTFSLKFKSQLPGCHGHDLFHEIDFTLLPAGSFLVSARNNLGGTLETHIMTDVADRSEAILTIARALSDQTYEGWANVQKTILQFAGEPATAEALTEWDPNLWSLPALSDSQGALMVSEAAKLMHTLEILLFGLDVQGSVHMLGPGACSLVLQKKAARTRIQLALSGGCISAVSVQNNLLKTSEGKYQDIITFRGAGIALRSQAALEIVDIVSRYLRNATPSHDGIRITPEGESYFVILNPRPSILELSRYFKPACP